MSIEVPSWFKGRQGKAEPIGDNMFKLTGPNLNEGVVLIHRDENGRWQGALRQTADGPDLAVTEPGFEMPYEAWDAAFELFRNYMIM
jgi:hypothetical protein